MSSLSFAVGLHGKRACNAARSASCREWALIGESTLCSGRGGEGIGRPNTRRPVPVKFCKQLVMKAARCHAGQGLDSWSKRTITCAILADTSSAATGGTEMVGGRAVKAGAKELRASKRM